MRLFHFLLLFAWLGLSACTVTPLSPIPHPLPEALEWATERNATAGSFLGLKTRENMGGGFDDLEFRPGIRVTRVVENSPAASSGVRPGDILLELNGVALDDPETLEALLKTLQPGARTALRIQRDDTVFELQIPLGVSADPQPSAAKVSYRLDPSRSRAAWVSGRGGVVLVASHERAPFRSAGVPIGSVVLELDGLAMISARALIRNLQARDPGSQVNVRFQDPSGGTSEVRVRLQQQPRRLTEFSIPILGTYRASPDGETASFVLLDLWFISLFRYTREGAERNLSVLRFLTFQSGIGELKE